MYSYICVDRFIIVVGTSTVAALHTFAYRLVDTTHRYVMQAFGNHTSVYCMNRRKCWQFSRRQTVEIDLSLWFSGAKNEWSDLHIYAIRSIVFIDHPIKPPQPRHLASNSMCYNLFALVSTTQRSRTENRNLFTFPSATAARNGGAIIIRYLRRYVYDAAWAHCINVPAYDICIDRVIARIRDKIMCHMPHCLRS